MAEADTSQALLAALDTRDIATIQSAMANYADAVQGVALQSAAFELVARMNEAKENEIDSLIAEMRQLATPGRPGSPPAVPPPDLGSPPAVPPPPPPPPAEPSHNLSVSVHSPELITSTLLKSHHVYRVEVKARDLAVPLFSVRRRFSDFDWLQSRLRAAYPGVLVPPLPEKQAALEVAAQEVMQVSGVSDDSADSWLEQRCAALGRMLARIHAHPMLSGSADLQAFLESSDEVFASYREGTSYNSDASVLGSGLDVVGGLLSAVPFFGAAAAAPPQRERDAEAERLKAQLEALRLHAARTHELSGACVAQQAVRAVELEAVGEGMVAVGRQEGCSYAADDTAHAAAAYSLVARSFETLAAAQAELARAQEAAFVTPVGELVREVGAAAAAVGGREAALLRLSRAAEAMASRRAAFEREKAAGAPKEELHGLKAAWEEAKQEKSAARAAQAAVVQTLDLELAGFRRAQALELRQAAVRFAKAEIAHAQRTESMWRALRDELELVAIGGTPAAGPGAVS
eukprot:Transcript_8907.p1 GENE.Transcript_8907~~Transcript_8907.p1  ORF type:complete len:518 (-),score=191.28 Transcript_8907:111-1664(-)